MIELLVVCGIIALLLSMLLPVLSSARASARTLVCTSRMRDWVTAFFLFADPYAHPNRGDSDARRDGRFSAPDFQESQYGVSEFWHTGLAFYSDEYRPSHQAMCPSNPLPLSRVSGVPLVSGGVDPQQNISYGMNRRLWWAPFRGNNVGYPQARRTTIGANILDHPNVPVIFEMNGLAAHEAWGQSFFSAPPGDPLRSENYYSVYDWWFPAFRHRGKMIIGFVSGRVVATDKPLADRSWDWDYHPPIIP